MLFWWIRELSRLRLRRFRPALYHLSYRSVLFSGCAGRIRTYALPINSRAPYLLGHRTVSGLNDYDMLVWGVGWESNPRHQIHSLAL